MDYLPITIKIVSANILIVGGGKVATHKAQILARFTDQATVVAPEITDELKALPFQTTEKAFEPSDRDGVQLLFVCTGDHELNHQIKQLAAERHILTSVCDDPAQCDFISPAISQRQSHHCRGKRFEGCETKHPSKKQNKRVDRK